MQEEWRESINFKDILVSDQGRVMNNWTQYILKPRPNTQGALMLGINENGKQHMRSVAVLVAKAFLDRPKSIFDDTVIHLNGDKTDCRAENLMWRPRWYAIRYHQQFKKRETNMSLYCADTDEVFHNFRDAAVKYGLLESKLFHSVINREPVWPIGYEFLEYRE